MATKNNPTPTKTYPATPNGRERAYQDAKKNGEGSITFKIPKPSK